MTINKAHSEGNMYSVSFLNDSKNNKICIITSSDYRNEYIKIWNLNGTLERQIEDSYDEGTTFIDNFYDKTKNKNYIISWNKKYFKSFDFNENKLYKLYYNKGSNDNHISSIILFNANLTKLIESSEDKNIRIWNFHSAQLLNKIKINAKIYGICLWNEKYIFASGNDKKIKMIEIKNGKILKDFSGHKNSVCSIKKINVTNLGECLISLGYKNDGIKIWKIKI